MGTREIWAGVQGTAGWEQKVSQGVATYLLRSPYTSASIFSGSRGHMVSRTRSPMAPGFPSSSYSSQSQIWNLSAPIPNSWTIIIGPGCIQSNQLGSRERSKLCPYTAPENICWKKYLKRLCDLYRFLPKSAHFSTQDSVWSSFTSSVSSCCFSISYFFFHRFLFFLER